MISYLIVFFSSIYTLEFASPVFDKHWDNILKEDVHPFPWKELDKVN